MKQSYDKRPGRHVLPTCMFTLLIPCMATYDKGYQAELFTLISNTDSRTPRTILTFCSQ